MKPDELDLLRDNPRPLIRQLVREYEQMRSLVTYAIPFVELAGNTSGDDYDPVCQECNGCNGRHSPGCALSAWIDWTTDALKDTHP
ncbi:MAG: hypothetical protein IMZ62_17265 [Chloroflexi bacterium]|nr:hypothetical protein [Chloroflexota bacterium]